MDMEVENDSLKIQDNVVNLVSQTLIWWWIPNIFEFHYFYTVQDSKNKWMQSDQKIFCVLSEDLTAFN